jgi:hypothetical protein
LTFFLVSGTEVCPNKLHTSFAFPQIDQVAFEFPQIFYHGMFPTFTVMLRVSPLSACKTFRLMQLSYQ